MEENRHAIKTYEDARALYENGELTGALNLLEKALLTFPKNPDLLNLKGLCCHFLCRFEEAKVLFQKSALLSLEGNKAPEFLSYYRSEEFNSLLEAYHEGERLQGRLEFDRAYALFETLYEDNENLTGLLLKLSECALGDRDYIMAAERAEELQRKDPDHEGPQKIFALLDELSRNRKRKWKRIRLSTCAALAAVMLLYGGSRVYGTLLKDRETLKAENLALAEELTKIRLEMESLKNEATEKKSAEEAAPEEPVKEEVLPPLEGTEKELFEEGLEAYRTADYEKALRHFHQISETGTTSIYPSEAVYFLSATYGKLLNSEKVKEYYRKYMETYPQGNYYEEVLYHYGLLLYEEGNLPLAQEVLKRIPEETPESPYNNSKVAHIVNEKSQR